jgi:hypothetical protein
VTAVVQTHDRLWRDLWTLARATVDPKDEGYSVFISLFHVDGFEMPGGQESGPPLYRYRDSYEQSYDPAHSAPWLTAWVKWDGCAELTFVSDNIHICGPDHAQQMAGALTRLYELAAELMPDHAATLVASL